MFQGWGATPNQCNPDPEESRVCNAHTTPQRMSQTPHGNFPSGAPSARHPQRCLLGPGTQEEHRLATLTQTRLPIHMPRCCDAVTHKGHLACRTAAGPTQEPRPIRRTARSPMAPHPNFTFLQEALAFVSFIICASVLATQPCRSSSLLLHRGLLPVSFVLHLV